MCSEPCQMSAEHSKQLELAPILEEPAFTKEVPSTSAADDDKNFRLKPAYKVIVKSAALISTW